MVALGARDLMRSSCRRGGRGFVRALVIRRPSMITLRRIGRATDTKVVPSMVLTKCGEYVSFKLPMERSGRTGRIIRTLERGSMCCC